MSNKNLIQKIELFLRGEFYLHLATMFIIATVILNIFPNLKWFWMFHISAIIGILWEFGWKYFKRKPVDLSDIYGTITGGMLAYFIAKYVSILIAYLN